MLETRLSAPLLRCAHCQSDLSECPEREFEDWIVRCLACSAKNVIEVGAFNSRVTIVEVVGYRTDRCGPEVTRDVRRSEGEDQCGSQKRRRERRRLKRLLM